MMKKMHVIPARPPVKIYACAICAGTFRSDVSDEQAIAEAELAGFRDEEDEPVTVCDDCYRTVEADLLRFYAKRAEGDH